MYTYLFVSLLSTAVVYPLFTHRPLHTDLRQHAPTASTSRRRKARKVDGEKQANLCILAHVLDIGLKQSLDIIAGIIHFCYATISFISIR